MRVKHNEDNQPSTFFNVYHKRKIPTSALVAEVIELLNTGRIEEPKYEDIKWAIAEGSSLTLLGIVKFDSENDRFVMTELGSVIGGGL